ncbi:MAG: hypothetical protein QMD17_15240 [Rhodocyclaceae bacterium]|nr:hypothetical protein [Rhodocyclaceae bacterium]
MRDDPVTTKGTLVFLFLCVASAASLHAAEIVPDEAILAKIDATAIRIRSGVTKDEGFAALRELDQACTNKSLLVQQVMLYLRFRATTEERGYGAIIIMNMMDVDKTTKIKAAMPLLDASDIEWQKIADAVLSTTDMDSACADGVDFSLYDGILRETPTMPPAALIRYMYKRNPQAAVVTAARIFGQNVPETEVAAKAKGGVKESADYFAGRSEWWAHLYVTETMKKQPHLRDAAILKKLEKDDHPLVKEKVAEITPGK